MDFFQVKKKQIAQEAVKITDNYRLDKNYTFVVSVMCDFDRYDKNRFQKKSLIKFFFSLI
jgi:hypothetical protein